MGVKITDTPLRHAHQSLLAAPMHTLVCHSERPPRPSGLPALRREGIWGGAGGPPPVEPMADATLASIPGRLGTLILITMVWASQEGSPPVCAAGVWAGPWRAAVPRVIVAALAAF